MPWQNPLVSVLWLMLSASVSLTKNGFSTWIHLRIKNTAWTFLPIFVCFFLFKNVKAFVNTFSAFIFLPYSLGHSPSGQDTADANLQKLTQLVNKESNLIEKVTFASVSLLSCCFVVICSQIQLQLYNEHFIWIVSFLVWYFV